MPERPSNFPAMAVRCPLCYAPPGAVCISPGKPPTRRYTIHTARTTAHNAQTRSTQ